MKEKIDLIMLENVNLNTYIDDLKKNTIESNKNNEQMSVLIKNLTKDIVEYEKQKNRANKFVQIIIPTTTIPLICGGGYAYIKGEKTLGKTLIGCGGILLIILIYNVSQTKKINQHQKRFMKYSMLKMNLYSM